MVCGFATLIYVSPTRNPPELTRTRTAFSPRPSLVPITALGKAPVAVRIQNSAHGFLATDPHTQTVNIANLRYPAKKKSWLVDIPINTRRLKG